MKRLFPFLMFPSRLVFLLLVLSGCFSDAGVKKITLRKVGEQVVFSKSGSEKPFYPVGFNYIRLRFGDHSTFEAATDAGPADYDRIRADSVLANLSRMGYNTVRVFITGRKKQNPGIAGSVEERNGLYKSYMDNFIDFLSIAGKYHLYVIPAFGDGELPISQRFRDMVKDMPPGKNKLFITTKGIAAREAYYRDFFRYLKDHAPELLPVILGVELQNEYCFKSIEWPFNTFTDTLTAANGKRYDMSDTLSRQALFEEMTIFYQNQMVRTIKEIIPDMLVGESIFTNRAVGKEDPAAFAGLFPRETMADWQERYPPNLDVLGKTDLDFIDIHFYKTQHEPLKEAFRKDLASVHFFKPQTRELLKQKPLILGEFGSFISVDSTRQMAINTILATLHAMHDYPFQGWLIWTYDTDEQPGLWNARQLCDPLLRELKPFQQNPGLP